MAFMETVMPVRNVRGEEFFWSVGGGRFEDAIEGRQGAGWVLLATTSADFSHRVEDPSVRAELLRRAWQICMDSLGEPIVGRHVTWGAFGFYIPDEHALPRIGALFGGLVSDPEAGVVPWHIAAARAMPRTIDYALPEWHSDYLADLKTLGPYARVDAQVSDHRGDDPRSWLILV
jgi:hypothetical protein